MPIIERSLVPEDRYIAYLAGLQDNQNPVDLLDRSKKDSPSQAQLGSVGLGIVDSISASIFTSLGLLTYPFVNSELRESILGSTYDVCVACGKNFKSFADTFFQVQNNVAPETAQPGWAQTIGSYGGSLIAGGACTFDYDSNISCRAANYTKGVWNTAIDNFMLLGAVTVGITTLLALSRRNSSAVQPQSEENNKKELTDAFKGIAARLIATNTNPKVQESACKILQRRQEIYKNLRPSKLTMKEIKEITKPVFDACKLLQKANQAAAGA